MLEEEVAVSWTCFATVWLFCMKRANKQTNEDGNDRTRCVNIKMKIKFVRNNDFEEKTDLRVYHSLPRHSPFTIQSNKVEKIYFYLSNIFGFRSPMMVPVELTNEIHFDDEQNRFDYYSKM